MKKLVIILLVLGLIPFQLFATEPSFGNLVGQLYGVKNGAEGLKSVCSNRFPINSPQYEADWAKWNSDNTDSLLAVEALLKKYFMGTVNNDHEKYKIKIKHAENMKEQNFQHNSSIFMKLPEQEAKVRCENINWSFNETAKYINALLKNIKEKY